MTKPNNPYARNIHATKDTAQTIGEFYGTRVTEKKLNHAAGGRNVSPAARYSSLGLSRPPTTPSPDATSPSKPKRKPKDEPEPAVTAEDLFQW